MHILTLTHITAAFFVFSIGFSYLWFVLFLGEDALPIPTISMTWTFKPANFISRQIVISGSLALMVIHTAIYYKTRHLKGADFLFLVALVANVSLAVLSAVCMDEISAECLGSNALHDNFAVTYFFMIDSWMYGMEAVTGSGNLTLSPSSFVIRRFCLFAALATKTPYIVSKYYIPFSLGAFEWTNILVILLYLITFVRDHLHDVHVGIVQKVSLPLESNRGVVVSFYLDVTSCTKSVKHNKRSLENVNDSQHAITPMSNVGQGSTKRNQDECRMPLLQDISHQTVEMLLQQQKSISETNVSTFVAISNATLIGVSLSTAVLTMGLTYVIAQNVGNIKPFPHIPHVSDLFVLPPGNSIAHFGGVIGSTLLLLGLNQFSYVYSAWCKYLYGTLACSLLGAFSLSMSICISKVEDTELHYLFVAIFFSCFQIFFLWLSFPDDEAKQAVEARMWMVAPSLTSLGSKIRFVIWSDMETFATWELVDVAAILIFIGAFAWFRSSTLAQYPFAIYTKLPTIQSEKNERKENNV